MGNIKLFDFIPHDKKLHFYYGLSGFLILWLLIGMPFVVSFIAITLIAISWEIWHDYVIYRSDFDFLDVIATITGPSIIGIIKLLVLLI
jgi:hypothetical protein